jgi:hypothetical protein
MFSIASRTATPYSELRRSCTTMPLNASPAHSTLNFPHLHGLCIAVSNDGAPSRCIRGRRRFVGRHRHLVHAREGECTVTHARPPTHALARTRTHAHPCTLVEHHSCQWRTFTFVTPCSIDAKWRLKYLTGSRAAKGPLRDSLPRLLDEHCRVSACVALKRLHAHSPTCLHRVAPTNTTTHAQGILRRSRPQGGWQGKQHRLSQGRVRGSCEVPPKQAAHRRCRRTCACGRV